MLVSISYGDFNYLCDIFKIYLWPLFWVFGRNSPLKTGFIILVDSGLEIDA